MGGVITFLFAVTKDLRKQLKEGVILAHSFSVPSFTVEKVQGSQVAGHTCMQREDAGSWLAFSFLLSQDPVMPSTVRIHLPTSINPV